MKNNLKSVLCCSLLMANVSCHADELFNYLGFGFTTVAIGYGIFHQLIIRAAFPKDKSSAQEHRNLKEENEQLRVQLAKRESEKTVQHAQQKAASFNSIQLDKLMRENKRLMSQLTALELETKNQQQEQALRFSDEAGKIKEKAEVAARAAVAEKIKKLEAERDDIFQKYTTLKTALQASSGLLIRHTDASPLAAPDYKLLKAEGFAIKVNTKPDGQVFVSVIGELPGTGLFKE